MIDGETKTSDNVVSLRPTKEAGRASEKKWGKSVIAIGFCIVPSLLLQAQRRLGLTPTQLAILMQLCDFWWDSERKPYPSKATLADRLGLSPRQVQRHVAELETAGLVQRTQRWSSHGGKTTNFYDLGGLVKRLQELEPEFRQVEEEARAARRAVSQPKHKRDRPAGRREPA